MVAGGDEGVGFWVFLEDFLVEGGVEFFEEVFEDFYKVLLGFVGAGV